MKMLRLFSVQKVMSWNLNKEEFSYAKLDIDIDNECKLRAECA